MSELYDGLNTLGEEEILLAERFESKGESSLAQTVRDGRLQHRFAFCCGYELSEWDGFVGLFKGLRDAIGVDSGLEWDEWKEIALERYLDDDGLKRLLQKQKMSQMWEIRI